MITKSLIYNGADTEQQSAGRIGNPLDIAGMVLFLCSDKAGSITGENICIDGGMTKQMICRGDHGRTVQLDNHRRICYITFNTA